MQSNDLGNKRRLDRKKTRQELRVVNSMNGELLGVVANLHEEGFMLLGAIGVKEGGVYQTQLVFTEPVDGRESLQLGVECLWLNETDVGTQMWAGFHIIDVADADKALIPKLVEQFGE